VEEAQHEVPAPYSSHGISWCYKRDCGDRSMVVSKLQPQWSKYSRMRVPWIGNTYRSEVNGSSWKLWVAYCSYLPKASEIKWNWLPNQLMMSDWNILHLQWYVTSRIRLVLRETQTVRNADHKSYSSSNGAES